MTTATPPTATAPTPPDPTTDTPPPPAHRTADTPPPPAHRTADTPPPPAHRTADTPPPPTDPPARTTRQQTAIRDYLAASTDFRTAQQIHDHLTGSGQTVSLPTVYRALTRLAVAGEVDHLRLASGQIAYRHCRSLTHHHHLICRHCHVAAEIAGDSLERWVAGIGQQYGFSAVDHDIELYGLCADCTAATGARPA